MGRRVVVALAVVGCLAVAGCSASGTTTAGTPVTPSLSAIATGPVTLRFAVFGDADQVRAYQRMAKAYQALRPYAHVIVETSPTEEAALTKLGAQFEQGHPPDVFLADRDDIPGLVAEGRVHPVDQLLEQRGIQFGDNYQRLGLEAMSAQSALQCMPAEVSPLVVFYNTALVQPARLGGPNVPAPNVVDGWTWQQFVRAARQAANAGAQGVWIPASLPLLTALVRSAGADSMDNDRTPSTLTLASPDTVAALQQVLRLIRNPRLSTGSPNSAVDTFVQGGLGMMIGTRALVPRLRAAHALSFDVLPLPSLGTPVTTAEMSGYCLAQGGAHLQAAADFLAFAAAQPGARIMARSGGFVPANLPALNSSTFGQPGQQPAHSEVFVEAVRRAEAMPFLQVWPDLTRQVQPMLQEIYGKPPGGLVGSLTRIDTVSQSVLATPTASPSG